LMNRLASHRNQRVRVGYDQILSPRPLGRGFSTAC
jgi:hypothetical protein